MKVGILGTGVVGQALGKAFLTVGAQVMMGSRSGSHEGARDWAIANGEHASAGSFADAASFGDIVVLATLGVANEEALRLAGLERLDGKVLIDTTNPLDNSGGGVRLAVGFSDSGGEQVQRLVPKAKVVKAFNTVGSHLMFRPGYKDGPPTMFICGDDDEAKARVAAILADFGWGVADIGGISGSRYLEPMCLTWVLYGFKSGTWGHAYKLLSR